ncbi:hypothetical protein Agub_g2551, partial [Astrephomene gubernaculifera]
HQLVLSNASEWLASQLERCSSSTGASELGCGGLPAASTSDRRPVLRIPLPSEAEVPSARSAIRFAYTGDVDAASIREALQVRRQAVRLQIKGCTAACDDIIQAKLSAAAAATAGAVSGASSSQQAGGSSSNAAAGGGGAGGNSSRGISAQQLPAVLELYACEALWPDSCKNNGGGADADDGPSFAAILEAAKPQLVSYFGDALRVLNTPPLRQQLLALPAVAVEALLESDSFGTDSESSVLLLLAAWMKVNYGKTDTATRKRLCRQVRLVQLSRPYLGFILPALARDHELSPQLPAGWFPISVTEAAFIAHVAGAPSEHERTELLKGAFDFYDVFQPSYNTTARTQSLPPRDLTCCWHVPQRLLERALAGLHPGGTV